MYALLLCLLESCSHLITGDGAWIADVVYTIDNAFSQFCKVPEIQKVEKCQQVTSIDTSGDYHARRFFNECAINLSELGIEKPIIEAAQSLDNSDDLYSLPVGAYIANMEDTDGATTHWVAILVEKDRSFLCETATNWRGGANDNMAHVLSPESINALQ